MKFYKKILKHTTFYGISNLFISLTGFILIPLYTKHLRPEEYGVYSIIALIGTVILYIYDMGILNALVRHYFEFDTDDIDKKRRMVSTALWFFIIVSILFSVFLLWCSTSISTLILGGRKYTYLLQMMIAIIFLKTVSGIPMTVLRMKEKSVLFMCLYGLNGLGIIVLSYIFLSIIKKGLVGVFQSLLLATIIFAISSFAFTFRNYGFSFSFRYLVKMLKYGLPLSLVMLFGWIINFSDRYLIRYFLSLSDVGLYSLGYKFGQIIYMAVLSFLMCWGPILFTIVKEQNHQKTLARLSTYIATVFMFVCLIVSFFCREIVILMAESSYYSSYRIVPLISFSYYLFGIYMLFLSGILISKHVSKQLIILGAASVINILLNIILIPRQGIMGAAVATIITYLFVVVYTYLIAQRSYPIPYELKRLMLVTLTGIIIFVFSLVVSSSSLVYTAVIKFIILCLFPISLFMLGIFNKAQLQKGKEIMVRAVFKNNIPFWMKPK